MAVELGEAYVSLVIEDSKVPGQVEKALKGAEPGASRAGLGIGSHLASGIGTTFKTAAAGIGLAAGAVIGTALSAGFSRMTAIDDAKGKLAGLGNSTQNVAGIMDSALASVKGTAFGLGEAATIAASAVAAGVKPGEDLTKYLKLTADAATIAGTSLGDMGSILNKVQTGGKAYTDDLNQLSDRGIPIFTWLQESYGKSADGLADMVKRGKIDAATFQKVIREHIGGAALESGKTLRGAWSNLHAALGRVGEAALSPFLDMMKGSLGGLTGWADKVTPIVKAASQNIATGVKDLGAAFKSHGASIDGVASNYEKWGVRARAAYDGVQGVWSILRNGEYKGAAATFGLKEDSGVVRTLFRIRESAQALWAALKSPEGEKFQKFFETLKGSGDKASEGISKVRQESNTLTGVLSKVGNATTDIGKSLLSLAGDTGTVAATGIKLIGSSMKFLADHAGVAATAMIGFVAMRGLAELAVAWGNIGRGITGLFTPMTLLATRAQTAALVAHNATMRAYLAFLGAEVPAQQLTIRQRLAAAIATARSTAATAAGATWLARFSAAQTTAAASSGVLLGALQRTTAATALLGSRVQGATVTAFSGLKNAAGGLMSMLGGPWGIALLAAGAGLMAYKSDADQAKRVQDALSTATIQGSKAQLQFSAALDQSRGALDANAKSAARKLLESNLASITEVANEGHSPWSSFQKKIFTWNAADVNKQYDSVQRAIDQNDTLKKVLKDQKLEMSDLGPIVAEGGVKYDALISAFEKTGDAGADVAASIRNTRDELQRATSEAKVSTPGFGTLSEAISVLADESSTADQRLSAMKRALDALSGKPVDVGDALQAYNQVLRDTADATQDTWDKAKGFGDQLIKDGQIDTATTNGDKLKSILDNIKKTTLDIASTGDQKALNDTLAKNVDQFKALAQATGLNEDQITALAASINLVPKNIQFLATLQGDGNITQKLAAIKVALEESQRTGQNGITVPIKEEGRQQVLDALNAAHAKVEEVTGQPGVFRIIAPTDDVLKAIQKIVDLKIPDKNFDVVETYTRIQRGINDPNVRNNAAPFSPESGYQHYAVGGSISGAGTGTSDSIPAMLSHGEHVWTAKEVDAVGGQNAMYGLRARALAGGFKFAKGGTPYGITEAVKAAQDMEGHPYKWGGVGPTQFDCSGFVGFLQQVAMGLGRVAKRLYTTNTLMDGATAGLETGLGPSGTWFQVGTSGSHMAATIAGMNVESGGAKGTSGIGGGRAGAADSQFTAKFHLPNSLIAGISSLTTGGKLIEWTDDDELELLQLQESVNQAKENRDKVYANSKSSDSDRRKADLDVTSAQNKVVKKQEQKDKQGQIEGGNRVAPQAPALSKHYTDEEKSYASNLQAVESANKSRNEVYDNPESTDADKQVADTALQAAIDKLENGDDSSSSSTKSVKSILTTFASNVVGSIFDAFKEQLPSKIGSSHWWDVADKAVELSSSSGDSNSSVSQALQNLGSFGASSFLGQLGYNKSAELPEWVKNLKSAAVYDTGGWLPPGGMAVNLSSSPEPIFNSPSQLQAFAGSQLQPAQGGGDTPTRAEIERMIHTRPNVTFNVADVPAAMQAFRVEQKRQSKSYIRR
ncbi:tape measure protein [Nocardia sp. SYP-A9097]|uniref:tape measure protein n=1 Tax=Nocardia sp. SYP-A9097 TaxID=2663237 RepID=UPI00129AE454|nr:tape measure protein [Nocardia sp. SYP-A9097]MRH88784.1 tape measure protein [Nocardia sp. SYP-A9097]